MRRILIVLSATLVGLAAAVLTASTAFAVDQSAITACQLAAAAEGPETSDLASVRAVVQQASAAAAQSAEPEIHRGATLLGRAARQQNPVGIHSALRAFGNTCQRTLGPTVKSKELPPAEFDRELHGVLDRTGESGAACAKQQVDGGWVAVCE